VEVAELLDLGRVRAVTIGAGDFEDCGEALELRMSEKDVHSLADLSLAEVGVAITVRSEWGGGVVHMQGAEAVEPDAFLHLVDACVECAAIRDVDS
jgi:hypothetical protein